MHELLALEAIDRLGSVQEAADALHVTPSGVSHRIGSLEKRIGAKLLQRKGRGIALTPLGRDYVAAVRPSLMDLAASTEALQHAEQQVIRIATAAAIGVAWLLPCIRRFAAMRSAARFQITTIATPDDLPADRWDLLIHYGSHPRRGNLRRHLFTERLIRVTAPIHARAEPGGPDAAAPGRPTVLRLTQLDGTSKRPGDGLSGPEAHAQLLFDDALTMLESVAAGAGAAWCTETAASPYLVARRLVRTADESVEGDRYFVDLSEAGQFKPLASEFFHQLVRSQAPLNP